MHSGGAKFDYEKAKWFNHEWIKKLPVINYISIVKEDFAAKGIVITDDAGFEKTIEMVKDRCTLLSDFYTQASFFFKTPEQLDTDAVKPKWNTEKAAFFSSWQVTLQSLTEWNFAKLEESFKALAAEKNIKPGDLQLPLRIMLVGGKFGPPVFEIAAVIGKEDTIGRIERALQVLA